ncbi:MAG: fatty-acid synthase [Acidobacteriota bacterium]|nr:fatty-acid synthase [Acidobacteriota bacterium]
MAQDFYHQQVKNALIKDGWTITDDPFYILYKGTRAYADLAAEKPMAAQKGERKIVVEIKVFGTPSPMTELERAVGQYGIYRTFLKRLSPERELFLAVAHDIWQDFFLKPAVQDIIVDHEISILVFNPETEGITQWIS